MYGYDIGGAEYPISPATHTIVDKVEPTPIEHPYTFYVRDLENPDWNKDLEPRPMIYIGRTLRYLSRKRLNQIGEELGAIWSAGGTMTVFDQLDAIEPLMVWAQTQLGVDALLEKLELVNPPENDGWAVPAEWRLVLVKYY